MLKQIGSGISCVVYLAEHKKLHHLCAIKCISKATDNSSIFLREAEFLRNLNNLYAPILYDYDEDAEYWYLIEEYIEGQSLYHLGISHKEFPQSRLMDLAIKICEAMKWLHVRKPYPVLYLDLKPEHIILTGSGIKLLDFGSAVYLKGEKISGCVMGTAGFASPEQLRGEQMDERSDIYSMGAIFYWLMTGETVVYDKPYKTVDGFTDQWNAIVKRCLEYEAGQRYISVSDLIADIRKLKQKKKKRQLDKSLKIAVTGSQSRVGTTHFSIGLTITCKKLGIKSLYEEKNDSGAVQEMFHNCKKVREKNGIYFLPGFEAIPKYGQAVYEEVDYGNVLVQDFGQFQQSRIHEYTQADCVVLVAGGKEWEIQQTKDLIERYKKRKDMYFVLRTGSISDFGRIKKELDMNHLFKMPEYAGAFLIGRQEQHFYKAFLDHIAAERNKESIDDEKAYKT